MTSSVHAAAQNLTNPVVSDQAFMENVRDALVNGYDECCAACGVGIAGDDMDFHDPACPAFAVPGHGAYQEGTR